MYGEQSPELGGCSTMARVDQERDPEKALHEEVIMDMLANIFPSWKQRFSREVVGQGDLESRISDWQSQMPIQTGDLERIFIQEIMFCDSVFHKIKCISIMSVILNQKEWIVSVDSGRAGLGCGEGQVAAGGKGQAFGNTRK